MYIISVMFLHGNIVSFVYIDISIYICSYAYIVYISVSNAYSRCVFILEIFDYILWTHTHIYRMRDTERKVKI